MRIARLVLILLESAVLVLASTPASADEAAIRRSLAERLPDLPKIDEITRSPVPGLYEVRYNGTEILYSNETGDFVFVNGSLVETGSRKNLTEARSQAFMVMDFDKLPLKDAIVIRQGTAAPAYPNLFVLRLDYLLEGLRAGPAMPPEYYDGVNFFWVKAATPAALDVLREQIDGQFANSPTRTRTEHEESFVANFTKMFGDIPRIVGSVGLVVLASILLVVGNTMSMSIRERARELAVLKAIGFPPWRILAAVLGESTLLGLIGGAIGCVAALLVIDPTAGGGLNMPYFPKIQVTPSTVALGVLAGALVGALAGLPPAGRVARQAVTVMLRDEG